MQFSPDRKQRSHKRMQCSASDSVGLIFTWSHRSTLLITTPTTTPSLVKTSLKKKRIFFLFLFIFSIDRWTKYIKHKKPVLDYIDKHLEVRPVHQKYSVTFYASSFLTRFWVFGMRSNTVFRVWTITSKRINMKMYVNCVEHLCKFIKSCWIFPFHWRRSRPFCSPQFSTGLFSPVFIHSTYPVH